MARILASCHRAANRSHLGLSGFLKSRNQPSGVALAGRGLAFWGLTVICLFQSFLPDPVLRLKGVIGLGGHGTKWVRGPMVLLGWTSTICAEGDSGKALTP